MNSAADLQTAAAAAAPGDVLVLKDGLWQDVDLVFQAQGKEGAPVTLRAATPGGVFVSGNSRLRLAGSHLQVEGLWFRDAFPLEGDVVAFRFDSKKTASHSRLSGCAITETAGKGDGKDRKWVSLYGTQNTVEHCHFAGKTGKGTLLVVWLAGEKAGHSIHDNYFGERLKLGKNGGEIIRVGDSDSSMQEAGCVVRRNLFEHCNGEVEIISNKSCSNLYQDNLFRECEGTLTLRHGNRCRVEGNAFFGNGKARTGGIRIIGEDHTVVGNYLEHLTGDEARAGICVMNGIVDSPANGYFQVKRAVVEGNFLNQCKQSINIGYADKDVKAPLEPAECVFRGNKVATKGKAVTLLGSGSGVKWKGSVVAQGTMLGIDAETREVPAAEVSYEAWAKARATPMWQETEAGPRWWKERE